MIVKERKYRNHTLQVAAEDDGLVLYVNRWRVPTFKTGIEFVCPGLPFRTFKDLLTLGEALIRSKRGRGISSEVKK